MKELDFIDWARNLRTGYSGDIADALKLAYEKGYKYGSDHGWHEEQDALDALHCGPSVLPAEYKHGG